MFELLLIKREHRLAIVLYKRKVWMVIPEKVDGVGCKIVGQIKKIGKNTHHSVDFGGFEGFLESKERSDTLKLSKAVYLVTKAAYHLKNATVKEARSETEKFNETGEIAHYSLGDIVENSHEFETVVANFIPKVLKIWVEKTDEAAFPMVQGVANVEILDSKKPLLTRFDIIRLCQQAFKQNIYQDSGSYLVIEKTEALTVIDVNSAHNVREKTAYHVNLEAVEDVVRLITLRNLSGIILVDFISMTQSDEKEEIIASLKALFAFDVCQVDVLGFTKANLCEIVRQRKENPHFDYKTFEKSIIM